MKACMEADAIFKQELKEYEHQNKTTLLSDEEREGDAAKTTI
jgi:hypothetical protein